MVPLNNQICVVQSSQVKRTPEDSTFESIIWNFRFIPAFLSSEFTCKEFLKFLPARKLWHKFLQSNDILSIRKDFSIWMNTEKMYCSKKCTDHCACRKCRFEFDTGCGNYSWIHLPNNQYIKGTSGSTLDL